MTHGRTAEKVKNSQTKNVAPPLTEFSKESSETLKALIANLEARVAKLEETVDRLDGVAPPYYYGFAEDTKKKPGPDKKISDASCCATAMRW